MAGAKCSISRSLTIWGPSGSCSNCGRLFPSTERPRYVLCDRDGKAWFGGACGPADLGVKSVQTAARVPWQNGVAER